VRVQVAHRNIRHPGLRRDDVEGGICLIHVMAGLDPAIQRHPENFIVLPWMAASEGGHDVKGYCSACVGRRLGVAAHQSAGGGLVCA